MQLFREARSDSEALAAGRRRHPGVFVVRPEWEERTFCKMNDYEKSIKRID